MRITASLLIGGLLFALPIAAHSQTPPQADKAPAAAPSTGAKAAEAAPKRDLGKEAMGGMGSSRSTMTPEQQKMRAAEKAEKQAQRAKKKAEDAQKKADEAKRQADAAQAKADAAKK